MPEATLHLPVDAVNLSGVPRLDEYFGLWAVEEVRFQQMLDHVRGLDLRAHLANPASREQVAAANGPAELTVACVQLEAADASESAQARGPVDRVRKLAAMQDTGTTRTEDQHYRPVMSFTLGVKSAEGGAVNIAVIDLVGTLMKQSSSMMASSSTIRIRRQIREAAANTDIDAILLRIDSPGGTVSGTADVAADVQYAASRKPTWAFIEDLGASAAYWIASQAQRVVANDATAAVGSIGTLGVVYDYSEAAKQQGIKAFVFRTGPLKGAGVPGTELTADQQAYFQAMVEETQKSFDQGVQTGRKLTAEQLAAVKTGGVFLASEARQKGLIDAIQRFDQVVADLAATVRQPSAPGSGDGRPRRAAGASTQEPAMSGTNDQGAAPQAAQDVSKPTPATLAQLKAAFPKLDAEFRESCIEQGMTMEQAAVHAATTLQARLENRETELDEARQAAAPGSASGSGAKRPGVAGVGTTVRGLAAGGNADTSGARSGASGASLDASDGDAIEGFSSLVRQVMKEDNVNRLEAVTRAATRDPDLHAAYLTALRG